MIMMTGRKSLVWHAFVSGTRRTHFHICSWQWMAFLTHHVNWCIHFVCAWVLQEWVTIVIVITITIIIILIIVMVMSMILIILTSARTLCQVSRVGQVQKDRCADDQYMEQYAMNDASLECTRQHGMLYTWNSLNLVWWNILFLLFRNCVRFQMMCRVVIGASVIWSMTQESTLFMFVLVPYSPFSIENCKVTS